MFSHIEDSIDARTLSTRLNLDLRALTVLLDALAALQLLQKSEDRYRLSDGLRESATADGKQSVFAMLCHQANCMRRWSEIARVVREGKRPPAVPSVRGAQGDLQSFIEAMDNVSRIFAAQVVEDLKSIEAALILDVGGASGTWTAAWLAARPAAKAILLDLPEVIPLARERLETYGLLDRVTLVPGNYTTDEFPAGADTAWLSAVVHQQSRDENRALYRRVFRALSAGGTLLIRDIVMDSAKISPAAGALFAVNMLVGTESGATFTLGEFEKDLQDAGFVEVRLARKDPGMNAVVAALKPRSEL